MNENHDDKGLFASGPAGAHGAMDERTKQVHDEIAKAKAEFTASAKKANGNYQHGFRTRTIKALVKHGMSHNDAHSKAYDIIRGKV